MAVINVRTDERVKEQATQVFDALGLDMSSAVNIFLKKSIMEQGIPFELKLEIPNTTTIKAMQESDEMVKNGCDGYSNLDDMWSALNV
ncbi:MAG: type II toxin-antitoxin system RelB/DinJ family antitoxin [Eubacteriales bacterium]|nr:type II toxin-antitoxin system RelB/DinJ family antitoxin [Eubacteriales bacterium]